MLTAKKSAEVGLKSIRPLYWLPCDASGQRQLRKRDIRNAVEAAARGIRAGVDVLAARAGKRAEVEAARHLPACSGGESGGTRASGCMPSRAARFPGC